MNIIFRILLVFHLVFLACQAQPEPALYFLSDCQQPLLGERLIRKIWRNEEGRDSIFAGIVRSHPNYLFLLGDLTGAGSKTKKWQSLDSFITILRSDECKVFAIPGNHEYMFKARKGIRNFKIRFGEQQTLGYCIKRENFAVVMLNSNFKRMSESDTSKELGWYRFVMDSLDRDPSIKSIIVSTHHPPFTNSKVVKPSKEVDHLFINRFDQSPKAKLFLSGHSHNLEYFRSSSNKKYLVIGGGGGPAQPLFTDKKCLFNDLLTQDSKPIYFFVKVIINGDSVEEKVFGLNREFKWVVLSIP